MTNFIEDVNSFKQTIVAYKMDLSIQNRVSPCIPIGFFRQKSGSHLFLNRYLLLRIQ